MCRSPPLVATNPNLQSPYLTSSVSGRRNTPRKKKRGLPEYAETERSDVLCCCCCSPGFRAVCGGVADRVRIDARCHSEQQQKILREIAGCGTAPAALGRPQLLLNLRFAEVGGGEVERWWCCCWVRGAVGTDKAAYRRLPRRRGKDGAPVERYREWWEKGRGRGGCRRSMRWMGGKRTGGRFYFRVVVLYRYLVGSGIHHG